MDFLASRIHLMIHFIFFSHYPRHHYDGKKGCAFRERERRYFQNAKELQNQSQLNQINLHLGNSQLNGESKQKTLLMSQKLRQFRHFLTWYFQK